jgi:hypothetical protein
LRPAPDLRPASAEPSIFALIDPIAYLIVPDVHSFDPLVNSIRIRFENFDLENAQSVSLSVNSASIDFVKNVPSIDCGCSELESCPCFDDFLADAVFVDGPNCIEMNALDANGGFALSLTATIYSGAFDAVVQLKGAQDDEPFLFETLVYASLNPPLSDDPGVGRIITTSDGTAEFSHLPKRIVFFKQQETRSMVQHSLIYRMGSLK